MSCQVGWVIALPSDNSDSSIIRFNLFDICHFPPTPIKGSTRYFVIFVDDVTCYTQAYLLCK